MREKRLQQLKEKEEKLKAKIKELQERKQQVKEQLESKQLISQLIPYFILPVRNCLLESSNAIACLKLILIYRCNKGKALSNPIPCLKNLRAQLLKLKEYTKSYPKTAKRVELTIKLLDLVLQFPEEEIRRVAKEVSAIPYAERVLRVAEEVLAEKSF